MSKHIEEEIIKYHPMNRKQKIEKLAKSSMIKINHLISLQNCKNARKEIFNKFKRFSDVRKTLIRAYRD